MNDPKSTTSSAAVAPAPAMGTGGTSGLKEPFGGLGEAVMPVTIVGIVAIE
ncbi:hypothetical protein ACFYSC_32880 [Streptosporangium sp. NPDC004379]|uniref:hypothetical protein n=1 Tax=Streptosporangium sp. NPDC004379 TaxID=3366189 RepID=UPI0036AF954B